MTDLPPGWTSVRLGEVSLPVDKVEPKELGRPNFRYVDIGSVDGNNQLIADVQSLAVEDAPSRARQLIRSGDTVFSTVRPYLKKIGYVSGELDGEIASTGFCVLRPGPCLDSRYLFHLSYSDDFLSQVLPKQRGVSYPAVRPADLFEIDIPLPPLVEQRRIVAMLEDHCSRLDFGVAQLRKVLLRIDGMRERVMAAACTGGLDVEPDDLFAPAPVAVEAVDGELPALPSSWRWTRLGELAEVVGGITKDSKKQSDPSIPLIPYLRVANVQRGRLELSEIAHIRVSDDKAEKLMLRRGDVLLNEGGDRDKLGRGWIWEGQIDRCIHQNHVFRARIHGDVLHPKLLAWHANGVGRKWFEVNGKQSVNLASISLSKIKMFPVPVPPRALQENLVSAAETRLSILDRSEALIREALAWASSLRRSLLTEAFAGRLVQQDPADEPASELMKRIRAERAAQPKAGRGRRTKTVEAPVAGRTEWPDAGRTPVSYEQEELL